MALLFFDNFGGYTYANVTLAWQGIGGGDPNSPIIAQSGGRNNGSYYQTVNSTSTAFIRTKLFTASASFVVGMAFYVVGVIQQLKSLKFLTIIWWSGAVFFFVIPSFHCLLFFAVMLMVSVWIPKIEEKKASQKLLTEIN